MHCQDYDCEKHPKIRLKELNPGNSSLNQKVRTIMAVEQPDIVGGSSRRYFNFNEYVPFL